MRALLRMMAVVRNVLHSRQVESDLEAEIRAYVDAAHQRGMEVKIYDTIRELSDRAPELPMLESLGHEIISTGSGGGFSWLQEHLDGDYIAAWHVPARSDRESHW